MTESNAVIPSLPVATSLPRPEDEWKLKTNAVYQEVMKSLMSLVTASLILPILFLRDFLGVKSGDPIRSELSLSAYVSWGSLLLSLLCGMAFYYFSAKFLKVVCGGTEKLTEHFFETWRDWSGRLAVFFFLFGLAAFGWFVYLRR